MPATDAELLERWRRGDSTAQRELFARYQETPKRYFRMKGAANAEDLAQVTREACLKSRERIEDFGKYLYGAMRGVWRSELRRLGLVRAREELGPARDFADDGPSPLGIVLTHERRRLLNQGLRSISPKSKPHVREDMQDALYLFYWEGLTGPEIADILDIPEATFRRRKERALKALSVRLAELAEDKAQLDSTLSSLTAWEERRRQRVFGEGTDASEG